MIRSSEFGEQRLLAVALVFGRPNPHWRYSHAFFTDDSPEAERFRALMWGIFSEQEVTLYGHSNLASCFTRWYLENENDIEAKKNSLQTA